jgi:hypothetical protein
MEQQQQLEQGHLAGDSLAPLLLVTTVDIGDGKTDRIEVRQGDVPLEVASHFVSKHGLPTAVVPRLAMHLEENLHKVESSRRAAVSIHEHIFVAFDHTAPAAQQQLRSTSPEEQWIGTAAAVAAVLAHAAAH